MDVFSLLKFWRNAGIGDPITAVGDFDFPADDDEGSFFDLVFTKSNDLEDIDSQSPTVSVISDFQSDHYNQQQLSKMDGAESNKSNSHSIFFNNNNKSKVLPLDSSSSSTSKTTPRSPFRVLMLGFQNGKTRSDNNNNKKEEEEEEMKCEIEEVTISSLLKRDNSLRNKIRNEKVLDHDRISSKRFSKDVVVKYLNLIKPLYVKASKRSSNEKVRSSSDHSPMPSPATVSIFSPRKEEKPVGRTVLFKEVRKHLGKSRSSSSSSSFAVSGKSIPSPAARRDDSALQQQDGIQSAILHCKKSYNSPSQGCNVLSRSGSAPSHGPRISIDEEKRCSI
ncbi:hypothetical protein OSB04_026120 [Centaurea solstitialis]|uniref:Membrane-associated kinase regulator 2 n=1 Tax=Centaurea solstitialis TaxID=347529 RepID=A0AA38W6Y2_9ASTR|nr:hypothetical protein OSB04_026120 [Centaurea solstitialis]